jgi:NADH-quinone oxidoreductase subunit M
METTTLLPLLVLIPLLCGFGILLLPKGNAAIAKTIALAVSLVVFALSVVVAWQFDFNRAAEMQLSAYAPWLPEFGVAFRFGVDSISLWLVLLTTFLMPITIAGAFSAVTERHKEFFTWLLVLEAAMIGVFIARDLILFYAFFELTLIPMYFLIGIFGSKQRLWASKKFFIFTLTGSLLTFAGLMWLAWMQAQASGIWTFEIDTLTTFAVTLPASQQAWLLGALMAGFAVKVPLFPVHTWLPLAHTEAPTAGSVILAGVLLKLGTYGLLRFALPMAPAAVVEYAPLIAVLSIIGIIYAALVCWVQQDIKKLVAYSSVSHLGFCVLGMFALNVTGVSGSVMYMINHGLSTGALFLCVGMIYERYHTRDMNEINGLGKLMPVWSTFFVFFCLASVGLPGLNGFVGEFLTILGTFTSRDLLGPVFAAFAALGLILAAIYILYMVGRVVMGQPKEPAKYAGAKDLNIREIAVLTPLAVGCVVLGLYPAPVLNTLEAPIAELTAEANAIVEGRGRLSDNTASVSPADDPSLSFRSGLVEIIINPERELGVASDNESALMARLVTDSEEVAK